MSSTHHNRPKVTLLFPVHNAQEYVERSLRSALDQTFDDIEYLIIDDHGAAESMDIVRQICSEHARSSQVRILDNNSNRGISYTRNRAVNQASAPYIFFMDSDDMLSNDSVERLYGAISDTDFDFVAGSVDVISDSDEKVRSIDLEDRVLGSASEIIEYNSCLPLYIMVWNKLFDLDFLRRNAILFEPVCSGEDDVFMFDVITHASSCRLLAAHTYKYRLNEASITGSYRRSGVDSRLGDMHSFVSRSRKSRLVALSSPLKQQIFESMIVGDALYRSFKILDSEVLTPTQKREYIGDYLDFSSLPKELLRKASFKFRVIVYIGLLPSWLMMLSLRLLKTKECGKR